MQVQWNSTTSQGTVVSSPSGCTFLIGDIKWTALDSNACTLSDLARFSNAEGYTVGDLIATATDAQQPHATQLIVESEFADTYAR